MSFDLAVLSGARPLEPDEARTIYEHLADGEAWAGFLRADPNVAEFVREVTRRWPQIDSVQEDQLDQCPWSQAFMMSPAHVIALVGWSRVDDVAPACIEIALRNGLNVFDPQEGVLHSPGQSPRAATPRMVARVCAACGKPIGQSDLSAELPGQEGVYHLKCMLGGLGTN